MNKTLVFFVALIFLFGGVSAWVVAYQWSMARAEDPGVVTKNLGAVKDYMQMPSDVPPDELITNFTLTERSGEEFDSDELNGSVHVASFFFASCPSTCRAQNEAMRVLHRDYGGKGVKFLSITVDPEQDSPERLREYAGLFSADADEWLFLTGDLLYTRRIGAEIYQMHVDKGVHTNRLAIVDKVGKLRGAYDWQDETQLGKMRQLIDQLIEEEPAAKESGDAPTETDPAENADPAEKADRDESGPSDSDDSNPPPSGE